MSEASADSQFGIRQSHLPGGVWQLRTPGFVRTTERSSGQHLCTPVTSLRYPLIGTWVTRNTAHPDQPRTCISSSPVRHQHPRQMPELQAVEFCGRPVGLDTPSTSRASEIRTYNPTGGRPHLRSPADRPPLRHPPATTTALNQKQPGATQLPGLDVRAEFWRRQKSRGFVKIDTWSGSATYETWTELRTS